MEFKPHDYQQYAIEYIETHEIAAILLDMGLGKTAITLTALHDLLFDYFEITRVLVIAPLRVARNTWPQEIEKWDHLKDVRYDTLMEKNPEKAMELAVKGMIPHNSIGSDAMKRLRLYAGSEHVHAAQQPQSWEL